MKFINLEYHPADSRTKIVNEDICQSLSARMGTGGNNVPLIICFIKSRRAQNPEDYETWVDGECANTINAFDVSDVRATNLVIKTDEILERRRNSRDTIGEKRRGGQRMPDKENFNSVTDGKTIVRRLTPLECERLQGFPDGWTDIGEWTDTKGKKHKEADSPRYKALGNSIALPFWQFLARRICALYERDITMGSLFDGISGLCLVFKRCGAEPVWTSEIEEFPIAVCKRHFGDEDTGLKGDINEYL